MSARFSTWIRIGGRIERSKIEPLLKAIREASVSLEWGDACFEPKDADELLEAKESEWLRLCDDQASWGEFPELEAACRKLGLGYVRHTEAALDCDAERVDFRHGMKKPLVRVGSNVNIDVTFVPSDALREVISHLEGRQTDKALRALRKLCREVPELPPFEVV